MSYAYLNTGLQIFHFDLQPWGDFRMYQQSSEFTRGAENIFHEIQDMTVHVLRLSAKYSDMQGVLQPLTMHCLPKSFCHEQEICL